MFVIAAFFTKLGKWACCLIQVLLFYFFIMIRVVNSILQSYRVKDGKTGESLDINDLCPSCVLMWPCLYVWVTLIYYVYMHICDTICERSNFSHHFLGVCHHPVSALSLSLWTVMLLFLLHFHWCCLCYCCYTGCFTTLGHNCRRWFPRFL